LTCIAGWSIGLAITWAIEDIFYSGLSGLAAFDDVGAVIMGITVGLFLGNTQWFILKQQVYQADWWILTSVVGWAISLKMGGWIIKTLDLDFNMEYFTFLVIEQAIEGVIAGIILGIITGGVLVWLLRFKVIPVENRWTSAWPFTGFDTKTGCVSLGIILTMLVCFIPPLICGDLSLD
jgi:hypothetical protein